MAGTTILSIVEEIKTLEQVEENILNINCSSTIKNVSEQVLEALSNQEKQLFSLWRRSDDFPTEIQNFTLPNEIGIRYLVRETYIETSRRRVNMFDEEDNLLPKSQRTITDSIQTVFFEIGERIYVILNSTNLISINKSKKLFGDKLKETATGEIEITEYMIDPDLFYWLFYKHEKDNGILEPRFEVSDIAGFVGNIADENHTIKGNSVDTPSLLVTKAFVSKFHPFRSLHVVLKYQNYTLDFILNDRSECYINPGCSIPNIRIDKQIAASIIIYGFIIPRLYEIFSEDEVWKRDTTKQDFTKNMGLEVIKEIADFHGISAEEIIVILKSEDAKEA